MAVTINITQGFAIQSQGSFHTPLNLSMSTAAGLCSSSRCVCTPCLDCPRPGSEQRINGSPHNASTGHSGILIVKQLFAAARHKHDSGLFDKNLYPLDRMDDKQYAMRGLQCDIIPGKNIIPESPTGPLCASLVVEQLHGYHHTHNRKLQRMLCD
jgi:hypothetical protein